VSEPTVDPASTLVAGGVGGSGEARPDQAASPVRPTGRRTVLAAAVVAVLAGGLAALLALTRTQSEDTTDHAAETAVYSSGSLQWSVSMPEAVDGYSRSPEQSTTLALLERFKSQGIEDPVGAGYVSDSDRDATVLIYGANGTVFGNNPDREISTSLNALGTGNRTVGTPVEVTLLSQAGEAKCAPLSGGGLRATVCMWVAHGAFLAFTFTGTDAADPANVIAKVPFFLSAMVRPA